jgi:hypothetical protein
MIDSLKNIKNSTMNKEEWIKEEVINYDWKNDGFGDNSIAELLNKGYERGYSDAMKLVDSLIKSLEFIIEKAYPNTVKEAITFVNDSKNIAYNALNIFKKQYEDWT